MGSPSYKYDIAPTTKRGEMTREGTAALIVVGAISYL